MMGNTEKHSFTVTYTLHIYQMKKKQGRRRNVNFFVTRKYLTFFYLQVFFTCYNMMHITWKAKDIKTPSQSCHSYILKSNRIRVN